jgi:hypothetical protein
LNRDDFEFDDDELNEWYNAWSIASTAHYRTDAGFIKDTKKLAWGYLKLPILLKYSPYTSDIVLVLLNLLSLSDLDVPLLETVCNINYNRLIPKLQSIQVDNGLLEQVTKLHDQFVEKLQKSLEKTNLVRVGLLLMNSRYLENFLQGRSKSEVLGMRPSLLRWQSNQTIGWLVNVESKKDLYNKKPLFDTPAKYAKSLLEIWSAFTFYWGAASMWPRCNHVSNNKSCNEPMIKFDNTGQTCRDCCAS